VPGIIFFMCSVSEWVVRVHIQQVLKASDFIIFAFVVKFFIIIYYRKKSNDGIFRY